MTARPDASRAAAASAAATALPAAYLPWLVPRDGAALAAEGVARGFTAFDAPTLVLAALVGGAVLTGWRALVAGCAGVLGGFSVAYAAVSLPGAPALPGPGLALSVAAAVVGVVAGIDRLRAGDGGAGSDCPERRSGRATD